MAINDGGSAFPLPFVRVEDRDGYTENLTAADIDHGGMTLRDYFAGQVLPAVYAQAIAIGNTSQDSICAEAYEIADSMLTERDKE